MRGTIDFLFHHGYTLLIAWVFAEQTGIPIPSIPILLAGGSACGNGTIKLGNIAALRRLCGSGRGSDLVSVGTPQGEENSQSLIQNL